MNQSSKRVTFGEEFAWWLSLRVLSERKPERGDITEGEICGRREVLAVVAALDSHAESDGRVTGTRACPAGVLHHGLSRRCWGERSANALFILHGPK